MALTFDSNKCTKYHRKLMVNQGLFSKQCPSSCKKATIELKLNTEYALTIQHNYVC